MLLHACSLRAWEVDAGMSSAFLGTSEFRASLGYQRPMSKKTKKSRVNSLFGWILILVVVFMDVAFRTSIFHRR